ncbi:hypothetical protein Efla_007577 [Eimeria flavescens]
MQASEPVPALAIQQWGSNTVGKTALRASVSDPLRETRRDAWSYQRLSRKKAMFPKGAVAVASTLMAAVMFIYMCMGLRNKVLKDGPKERVLGARSGNDDDTEDDNLKAILDECIALAEDTKTHITPVASFTENEDEPAWKEALPDHFFHTLAPAATVPTSSQPLSRQRPTIFQELLPSYQSIPTPTPSPWTVSDAEASLLSLLQPHAWLQQIPHIMQEAAIREEHAKAAGGAMWSSAAELPSAVAAAFALDALEDERTLLTRGPYETADNSPNSRLFPTIGSTYQQQPFDSCLFLKQNSSACRQQHSLRPDQDQAGVPQDEVARAFTEPPGTEYTLRGDEAPATTAAHDGSFSSGEHKQLKATTHFNNLTSGLALPVLPAASHAKLPPDVLEYATQPSTLAELPPRRPWDARTHPYVRVPDVEPETIVRNFRPDAPLDSRYHPLFFLGPLQMMRMLLTRRTLSADDVEELLVAAESLVHVCRVRMEPIAIRQRPNEIVRKLSMRFLILDALVAARYVLRERMLMAHWWPLFAERFSADIKFNMAARGKRQAVLKNFKRIRDLLDAIEVYKKGVRPDDDVVIWLKRRIFDARYVQRPYAKPAYNPWRQDDELFRFDGDKDVDDYDSNEATSFAPRQKQLARYVLAADMCIRAHKADLHRLA